MKVNSRGYILFDKRAIDDIEKNYGLRLKLTDSEGYYVVSGVEEVTLTSDFLEAFSELLADLEKDYSIISKTISHDEFIFYVFYKK